MPRAWHVPVNSMLAVGPTQISHWFWGSLNSCFCAAIDPLTQLWQPTCVWFELISARLVNHTQLTCKTTPMHTCATNACFCRPCIVQPTSHWLQGGLVSHSGLAVVTVRASHHGSYSSFAAWVSHISTDVGSGSTVIVLFTGIPLASSRMSTLRWPTWMILAACMFVDTQSFAWMLTRSNKNQSNAQWARLGCLPWR